MLKPISGHEVTLYCPNFIADPSSALAALQAELKWERRGSTPRSEYYINRLGPIPYQYGRGAGVRIYQPAESHPVIDEMFERLKLLTGSEFDVCFLNRYHDQSDHLGWHSDDSPEMDDSRPIAIVSLGVERIIMFRPSDSVLAKQVTSLTLKNGSLCLMTPGMQDTHQHRIPKASFQCGERISLTFRGYVKP